MDLSHIGLYIWFAASAVILAGIFVGRRWPKIQDKMVSGSVLAICVALSLIVYHAGMAFLQAWREVQ